VERSLIIAGDVTVDWFIARAEMDKDLTWNSNIQSKLWRSSGGAALLSEVTSSMIEAMMDKTGLDYTLHQSFLFPEDTTVKDPRFHHSCSLWVSFKRKRAAPAWRMPRVSTFVCITVLTLPIQTSNAQDGGCRTMDRISFSWSMSRINIQLEAYM